MAKKKHSHAHKHDKHSGKAPELVNKKRSLPQERSGHEQHVQKKKKKSTNGLAQSQADFDDICDMIDANVSLEKCISLLEKSIERLNAICSANQPVPGLEHSTSNPSYLLANVIFELGKLHEDRGEYVLAKKTFAAAVKAFPRTAGPRVYLAKMIRVCGTSSTDIKAAENQLEKAIAIGTEILALGQQGLYDPAYETEMAFAAQAQEALAFLLCQEDRNAEAREHLKARGYTWRLGRDVLHYPDSAESERRIKAHGTEKILDSSHPYVHAVDNVLPNSLLTHMQKSFGNDSSFWREHNYGPNTPYFSYLHKLKTPDTSNLDFIINTLYQEAIKHYPDVRKAKYAEWWAHCRPHSHGHQLHFDSDDEGRSRADGGPTLVTDQILGASLATQGWVVSPKVNRYCMFTGNVLHGVIPGRGQVPEGNNARRVTFMVAFWEDIKGHSNTDGSPGSAQPFPYAGSKQWELKMYEWPMLHDPQSTVSNKSVPSVSATRVTPVPLQSVWEELRSKKKSQQENNNKKNSTKSRPLPMYDECFQGF